MGKYRSTRTANFALAAATSIIAMLFGTCEIAVAAPLTLKDTKVTGCKKFVISDNNKNWKAMGFMVVQGSSCPADFNGKKTIQGKMISDHSVQLGNGKTCRFDNHGAGKCT